MAKKSNHLPKNTTIYVSGLRAELFWQTANCDHFMANFRADINARTARSRFHDLRFSQVASMLSGNVLITPSTRYPEGDQYDIISLYKGKYYFSTVTIDTRTDCPDTLFCNLITTFVTYEKRHLDPYEAYLAQFSQNLGRTQEGLHP